MLSAVQLVVLGRQERRAVRCGIAKTIKCGDCKQTTCENKVGLRKMSGRVASLPQKRVKASLQPALAAIKIA